MLSITIITEVFPYPLTSGGAQAQYNMIDELRHKYNIAIIYAKRGIHSKMYLKELQRIWPEVSFYPYSLYRQFRYLPLLCDKIDRALKMKITPASNRFKIERLLKPYGYYFTNDFITFVKNAIKKQHTDIIQVEFYPYLSLIHYLPEDIKRVFVHHEIRFIRNERLINGMNPKEKDKQFMQKLKVDEINDLNMYDEIVTLTDVDKDTLKNAGVYKPIFVSPATINTNIKSYIDWNNSLVFIGGYGHTPNVEGMNWLSKKVFPLINWEKMFKNVSFNVIGKGWNKNSISGIPQDNIRLFGFIPNIEDIAYGGIMVVPILSGSGMRMKILEGMAMCMSVITTSVGVEGINLINEDSCLIADTPEAFAEALIRLMTDEELRMKLATNAQKVFIKNYSKKTLADIRNEVYKI